MGLLTIRTGTFYWVSQLGMLPGTAVFYVNAGTQLGQLSVCHKEYCRHPCCCPLVFRRYLMGEFVAEKFQVSGAAERWRASTSPRKFDHNLIVIGAGSAGLVTALITSTVKASVTLIERHKMGGDCLNTGCVPSKALIRSARSQLCSAGRGVGLAPMTVAVNFPRVMQRVQDIVRTIEPHDSVERFNALGVNCVQGDARILSPWAVQVNGQTLTARNIVIASGARPRVPDIPGWQRSITSRPTPCGSSRIAATPAGRGGGPIGCELAQAFARLGSNFDLAPTPSTTAREDADVAEVVHAAFSPTTYSIASEL